MALLANVRDSFGSSPRYVYVRSYQADFDTGLVIAHIEIFTDKPTRLRHKAAKAALKPIPDQIIAKKNEQAAARAKFLDLGEEERAATRARHQAEHVAFTKQVEALEAQERAQREALDASEPGVKRNEPIQVGVPINPDGTVLKSDIYNWLAANDFPGATRID